MTPQSPFIASVRRYINLLLWTQALPLWPTRVIAARLPIEVWMTSDAHTGLLSSYNSTRLGHIINNGTQNSTDSHSQVWPDAYHGVGTDAKHNVGIDNPFGFDNDFFEATEANVNASNVAEAYDRWMTLVEKNNSDWEKRTSELQFFLQQTLDWTDNVECSLTIKGCQQVPSPREVNNVIWNKEHARQICFIIDHASHINLEAGVTSDLALNAEVTLQAEVEAMARTFYWQFDQSIEDKCKHEAAIVQAVITAVEMAAIAFAPMLLPGVAATTGASAVAMKVEQGTVKAERGATKVGKLPGFLTGVRGKVGKANKGKTNVAINALKDLPGFLSGPALEKAMCDRYPNAKKGSEEAYKQELARWISKASLEYQTFIDSEMADLNKGTGLGENGSFANSGQTVFAASLYDDHVILSPWEHEHYLENPHLLTEILIRYFTNAAISMALERSMCYLHCTSDPGSPLVNATHQFVPETGVVCQAQCLQDWKTPKQIGMFGTKQLDTDGNEYGINATEYWHYSYEDWKETRYSTDPTYAMPTISDLWSENSTELTSGGSSLPVCFSPQPLHDYTNTKDDQDKPLPCICGDEFGNETLPFQVAAKLNTWTAFEDGKGLAEACAESFETDPVSPVQTFLTYCDLEWHWPNHKNKELNVPHDSHHLFANNSDPYCGAFKDEVQVLIDKNVTFDETNCQMCAKSNTSAGIFEHQKDKQHVKGKPSYNHAGYMWEGCLDFLFKDNSPCEKDRDAFCRMPRADDLHVKHLHHEYCRNRKPDRV